MSRVLVAGVGNVLKRDDGFGPAVIERLGEAPAGVQLIETGIGGVALLQEIQAGCDGLVIVDAVDLGEPPGTVLVIEPEVDGEAEYIPDMHLVDPNRVLSMAKKMDLLPERVLIVGCQPVDAEHLGESLSPPVARAVDVACARVREIVADWTRAAA